MARRRITYKRRPRQTIQISPETQRGIAAIFFFATSAVLLLAYFGLAGAAGAFVNNALVGFLGSARIILPVILAALGALFVIPQERSGRAIGTIGLALFLLGFAGLLDTLRAFAGDLTMHGGYLGLLVSAPLLKGFGRWATLVIFIAIVGASILLAGNTSLERIAGHGKILGTIARLLLLPLKGLQTLFHRPPTPRILEGGKPVDAREEPTFVTRELPLFNIKKTGTPPKTENRGQKTEPPSEFTEGLKPRGRRVEIPLDLLNAKTSKPSAGDIKKNIELISQTLAHFGITVEMGDVSVGPTVTQYTLKPQEGVKLAKITALANDLSLALAAHPIRIEAPIPGKSLVGIEVPNQTIAVVPLREVLDTPVFRARKSPLELALGKDVAGEPWFAELPRLPHLLVAGATGSGKTVCLNSMIVSLLYQNGPDDMKLILIDPKRVELPVYNGIPHLLVPTITDVPKTVNALKWAIMEMERRFRTLEQFGVRDLTSYNARAETKMPTVVIVVDELADLMVAAAHEIESSVIRIAQMARAIGIHLILATQRPSVDVITGLIKANIPARIAFAVASQTDSRTILDTGGAEKLLGRGDMLFTAPELSKPRRIQGALISDEEINRVVEFLKEAYDAPSYDVSITEKQRSATLFALEEVGDGDPLLGEAKEVILQAGKASASLLQRRLKVGYARAARLLDLLETEGFIGPGEGAKPRDVLAAPGGVRSGGATDDEEMPWQ